VREDVKNFTDVAPYRWVGHVAYQEVLTEWETWSLKEKSKIWSMLLQLLTSRYRADGSNFKLNLGIQFKSLLQQPTPIHSWNARRNYDYACWVRDQALPVLEGNCHTPCPYNCMFEISHCMCGTVGWCIQCWPTQWINMAILRYNRALKSYTYSWHEMSEVTVKP
jgi:hypothetical protein